MSWSNTEGSIKMFLLRQCSSHRHSFVRWIQQKCVCFWFEHVRFSAIRPECLEQRFSFIMTRRNRRKINRIIGNHRTNVNEAKMVNTFNIFMVFSTSWAWHIVSEQRINKIPYTKISIEFNIIGGIEKDSKHVSQQTEKKAACEGRSMKRDQEMLTKWA